MTDDSGYLTSLDPPNGFGVNFNATSEEHRFHKTCPDIRSEFWAFNSLERGKCHGNVVPWGKSWLIQEQIRVMSNDRWGQLMGRQFTPRAGHDDVICLHDHMIRI